MNKEKEESQETPDDENKESMETQKREKSEGTEEHSEHVISEEFQHEVIKLCEEYSDSKPCLEFMRDHVNNCLDKLREKEREEKAKKMKKETGKTPNEFSMDQSPVYAD